MNALVKKDPWAPVHRGAVYCSPRCGFSCRMAAYDRAIKEGDALAARMGDGWKCEVWENWGWRYRAEKGAAAIHANVEGSAISGKYKIISYTVFFNSAHQVVTTAGTPEDALGFAMQEARGIERKIAADCAALLA